MQISSKSNSQSSSFKTKLLKSLSRNKNTRIWQGSWKIASSRLLVNWKKPGKTRALKTQSQISRTNWRKLSSSVRRKFARPKNKHEQPKSRKLKSLKFSKRPLRRKNKRLKTRRKLRKSNNLQNLPSRPRKDNSMMEVIGQALMRAKLRSSRKQFKSRCALSRPLITRHLRWKRSWRSSKVRSSWSMKSSEESSRLRIKSRLPS